MKKVIKMTEGQFKKITQMLISEQGAMDDILNNSPNAPTYKSGTPTANSPKPTYGEPPKTQTTSKYFTVIEKYGLELVPHKFNDPNARDTNWSDNMVMTIYTNGRVNLWTNSGDFNPQWMGTMKITGDNSFKIIYDDGEVYNSVTNSTGGNNEENLYVNCANSLDEIKEGSVKILKYGCKTNAVKDLQILLGMEDRYHTGYFGKITKGKVIEFQKSNKDVDGNDLKPDGIVGFKTFMSLTSDTNTDTETNTEDDSQKQNVDEYYDDTENEDYNELDSLFDKNFNTEDDYDGEMFRGDDEGFSNKMRQNQIHKKMRLSSTGLDTYYKGGGDLKSNTIPRDQDGDEVKWSPLKSDDLPLNKYLEKKKMRDLDEDEDIAMLDNLFTKNEINEQSGGTYEQLKAEWSKVNSDNDTSTKGFGEGKSSNESIAMRMGQMNARLVVAKKAVGIKPSDNKPFDQSISASEIEGKMYKMGNTYVYLCVMDKN
jgi:hypothetical protein